MSRQNELMFAMLRREFPNAKADLATAFVDQAISLTGETVAVVLPQNLWRLLSSVACPDWTSS